MIFYDFISSGAEEIHLVDLEGAKDGTTPNLSIVEQVAREIQEAYEEENPKAGIVAEYLDRLLPAEWDDQDIYARRQWLESGAEGVTARQSVCTLEIWTEALGGNPDKFDRYAGKEIADIMAKLPEWRHQGNRQKTIRPYGRQRYYERS